MTESCVVLAPDLMDRSKISQVVPDAKFVRSAEDLLASDANLLILDLSRDEAVKVLPLLGERAKSVIAFASHKDRQIIESARAVGCRVMARSEFFGNLTEVLAG